MRRSNCLLFLFCILSTQALSAQKDWTPVGPFTPAEAINAIATDGNGAYVAVADKGIIYHAPNINDWQLIHTPSINGNITEVVYFEQKWVLATDTGKIAQSNNGLDWAVQSVAQAQFYSIQIFKDALFVFENSRILKSLDASNWVPLETNGYGQEPLSIEDVKTFENQIVVVSGDRLLTSEDGTNWSHANFSISKKSYEISSKDAKIVQGDGFYMISRNGIEVAFSNDLVNWTTATPPIDQEANHEYPFEFDGQIVYFSRFYNGEKLLNNGTYVSRDNILEQHEVAFINPIEIREPYEEDIPGTLSSPPQSISYYPSISGPTFNLGDRVFVTSELGALYSSVDLINWKKHLEPNENDLIQIASDDNRAVALFENGDLLITENGTSWDYIDTEFGRSVFGLSIFNGHIIIAEGTTLGRFESDSNQTSGYDRIHQSTDGIQWTTTSMDWFKSMTVHNDQLYIASSGGLLKTDDLLSWETILPVPPIISPPSPSRTTNTRVGFNLHSIDGSIWGVATEGTRDARLPYIFTTSIDWLKLDSDADEWTSFGPDPRFPYSKYEHTSQALNIDIRIGDNALLEISLNSDLNNRSRIVAFNAYGYAQQEDKTMITGFATKPTGTNTTSSKQLIRGRSISSLENTPTPPQDTYLLHLEGDEILDSNNNADVPALRGTFLRAGASSFPLGTTDSALETEHTPGVFTSHLTVSEGGKVLSEIFDISDSNSELINISARAYVSGQDTPLILGFTLEGPTSRDILIRGIGANLEIGGELPDPDIVLLNDDTDELPIIGEWPYINWTKAEMNSLFEEIGAFPIESNSSSSTIVTTIPPGVYTVELASPSNQNGIALIEIYLLED